jgi:hypothetical protein
VPELAAVLSRAFADRPPFTWVLPDDELRARVQPAMFHAALRSGVEVACAALTRASER